MSMSEEFGKIEKPSVEEFKSVRKLYFVPLVFSPPEPQADLAEKISNYWDQVESHLSNLEVKLGSVTNIYHELVSVSGEVGTEIIEKLNTGSHQIVKARLDKGAELQPVEDGDLLTEFMDWGKCLAVGLQNEKVFVKIYEFYSEAQKRRRAHIAKYIDETLREGKVGLLLMREGHQVQFPPDIQVFYVAPPALDEIRRWLRARENETQAQGKEASGNSPE